MEVAGALSIFQRSQSLYNVRYTKYLGDGDSKAFTSIVENKVYGDHCSVEKLECIGHVMKRMGTRLRRLKTKMRGQKLSDGKPLCGRNRLTEAEIDRLQAYYGLAIHRNLSSVKDMQHAIWAIFLHKLSTDEKPQHGFCPSDTDTWCKFKKAELLGETYHHKNSLPVDVVEAMRPVFRDLANPELLKKCLHGGTQNSNESVNNLIWSRVPKKTFVQLEVLSLGTYDAVSSFNMGNVSKLEILRKMCIEPGDYTVQAMECLDKQRLLRTKYSCLQKTKELSGEFEREPDHRDENCRLVGAPCCWPGGSFGCAVRNCCEQVDTRKATHVRKTVSGTTRKTTRREDQRIVPQASCGPHHDGDSFNDTTTRRRHKQLFHKQFTDTLEKQILNQRHICHGLLFTTTEHRQLRPVVPEARSMWNVHRLAKVVFSDESGLFWGQMIAVYGVEASCVSGTITPTLFYVTLPAPSWCNGLGGHLAYDSRSTLIMMRGTLTDQHYVDDDSSTPCGTLS
ncbi:uncharacterized protein TNCV_4937511 [Trichonephila clavipes]|nr:uncharacterized protein TNCV_4937511 [Trichonephila clavipes]